MIIKILISLFVLFAASRAYLRYRSGTLNSASLFVWVIIWTTVGFFVWWPRLSSILADSIGVGRGVDALVYISIVALFYGMFRLYVKLEFIEHEITQLVRKKALEDKHDTDEDSPSK